MNPEQIIASDPKLAKILDTTKRLRCADSKEFSKEINKYIDSKNQKRGDNKVCFCSCLQYLKLTWVPGQKEE
jgi:hypothetical protein